ncbi:MULTISPECIES: group 1 truncated hemoglobin [unclassified Nostoc]|uniref:globin domain-containing protein n=1 Tax=unclassified Nostoc TaxID=2593658 RepID=UPI002AD5216F|nr:group 1 truncated hemoglobin [Nostoc sp. DedQUE03]MDZ7976879.1 group 1 truncated hemoglobin [Nostoc sp. DedQUE03]MDZ8043373.1 group 1 truncated hemoglobin [Nostoc sp. DedQUE02]
MSTLYDNMGGQPAIEQVVDELHKRIATDSLLAPIFAGTDMAKQRNHLVAFLAQIFEGPKQYGGRPMDKTHAGLNLQQQHFDAIAKHLSEAMAVRGVSAEDTKAALDRVTNMKGAILNK